MKRWLLGFSGLLMSGMAVAAGPAAARKSVQASMLVKGTIEVAPDGHVSSYALDHPEKLPPVVKGLVQGAVSHWTFDPIVVDGHPAIAKGAMSLRVIASPLGDGRYSIRVGGVVFGNGRDKTGHAVTAIHRSIPKYPERAVIERVAGTVYVVVRIDRQGRVADAVARQVDLRVIGDSYEMASWRGMLSDAALRAIRRWTFRTPTVGKDAQAPYWQVTIPVAFTLRGPGVPQSERPAVYGQWQAYVPGPVHPVPWADKPMLAGNTDAVPDGGVFRADPLLHLRTPLGGS